VCREKAFTLLNHHCRRTLWLTQLMGTRQCGSFAIVEMRLALCQQLGIDFGAILFATRWTATRTTPCQYIHNQFKCTCTLLTLMTSCVWQRKCGHFMWVDQPISRAEKVSVMKLEAENRRLRSSLLSLKATMRNVTNNHAHQLEHIGCCLHEEVYNLMLMIIIFVVYTVMMMTFTSDSTLPN